MEGSFKYWTRSSGAPTLRSPARMYSQVSAAVFLAEGCGAKMTALRVLRIGSPLQQMVEEALVTGVSAPITPTGLASFMQPLGLIFLDHPDRLQALQVAQGAERFLLVLEHLVLVDAHAGLLDRRAGAGLGVRALVDLPAGGGDHLVHLRLGPELHHRLGSAGSFQHFR